MAFNNIQKNYARKNFLKTRFDIHNMETFLMQEGKNTVGMTPKTVAAFLGYRVESCIC